MKNIWHNLSEREQIFLSVGGIIVIIFIIFIAILKPLYAIEQNSFIALEEEKVRYNKVVDLLAKSKNSPQSNKLLKKQELRYHVFSLGGMLPYPFGLMSLKRMRFLTGFCH